MTIENLIIIKAGSYNDIKKTLLQWIELYSEDINNEFTFELCKNGQGNYIIKADESLDNERFFYLVNYLNYPEGIEYKFNVEGFTIGKEQKKILKQKILVYIPENDKEGDNVFVITEDNETFKIDFGGKVTTVKNTKRYSIPNIEDLSNFETIRIDKKEISQKRNKKSKDNLKIRFKIISFIALGLFIISLFTLTIDIRIFQKLTLFLGLGLWVWFFSDYKMLQIYKYYIYSFFIAIVFLCYGIIIKLHFTDIKINLVDIGSFNPLLLLVVQKPLRLFYKKIFKREPVIDKPPPTFWDVVYMIILFLSFSVLPLIIMDNLKCR